MSQSLSNKDLTKSLLLLAGGVVLLPALAISPGLGAALKLLIKNQNYSPGRINQTLKRLQNKELVSVTEKNGKTKIELSIKGKIKIMEYKLEEMKLLDKNWDGWWRFVVFDIPESKRLARDYLRVQLKELNFYMLQKSVLVTPWDCRKEIDFLRYFYQVQGSVSLLLVKKFDEEEKVRNYFRLNP
jgi:DNA-binding transcriptional regulator PaaX